MLYAARRYESGERADMEAGMAKLFASETAMEIALNAVRVHGGYGYSTEFDVERYFRDAPLMIVGEGTNEIQRNVIARQLIKRNRSPMRLLNRRGQAAGQRQPLDGITVVALEQAVAAPFATRQLADLGARVIKVERPGTRRLRPRLRPDRARPVQLLRLAQPGQGKRRAGPQGPDDRALLAALIDRADVFVQNLAPGRGRAARARGRRAAARHPRLIYCSISGYGPDGPYRAKKAYDLLVQCEAGLVIGDRHPGGARQGRASRWPTSPPACTPTPAC